MDKYRKKLWLCLMLISSFFHRTYAQETIRETPHCDIFMGVSFNYRNIHYNNKLYDFLINLTPGMKWQMGHNWQIAIQGIIPVVNDYGERYKKSRLNMSVISKELYCGNQFIKINAGLFGQERYGIDVKWLFPVRQWIALEGQVGYTGFCSMAKDWECSKIDRFTGTFGTRFYIEQYNTEICARGGRYIYEDYGVQGECIRHFKHCTIGVYAQYSDKGKENGGFKVIMMLPPYNRKTHKVNVRPASNFRFTYNTQADPYSMQMYNTDPEENEREGWFNRDKLKWGCNNMKPNFIKKGGEQ